MLKFLDKNAAAIISALISIIGFIVTYIMTKRNLKNELLHIQRDKSIELIKNIPYDILKYFDSIKAEKNQNILLENLQKIISQIYAYGSYDAIKILVVFQRINYAFSNNEYSGNKIDSIILLSLLVSQIKYDITGETIMPLNWLQIKINDYNEEYNLIAQERLNYLINKFDFNKRFLIKK